MTDGASHPQGISNGRSGEDYLTATPGFRSPRLRNCMEWHKFNKQWFERLAIAALVGRDIGQLGMPLIQLIGDFASNFEYDYSVFATDWPHPVRIREKEERKGTTRTVRPVSSSISNSRLAERSSSIFSSFTTETMIRLHSTRAASRSGSSSPLGSLIRSPLSRMWKK